HPASFGPFPCLYFLLLDLRPREGKKSRTWNRRWNLLGRELKDVALNVASLLTQFQHCNVSCAAEPVLVPPTWNKAQYQEVTSIWQRAADRLSEVENIMVVDSLFPRLTSSSSSSLP